MLFILFFLFVFDFGMWYYNHTVLLSGSRTARPGRIIIFKEDIALCFWALLVS